MTNTIQTGQTLTSRSLCDYDCIFSLKVIDRKGSFATILMDGDKETRRVKVRNFNGEEYLRPDNYSMAPTFRAK